MNKVVNTYWIDARLATQTINAAPRASAAVGATIKSSTVESSARWRSASRSAVDSLLSSSPRHADSNGATYNAPSRSLVWLSFIILALFVGCIMATMRTQARMSSAAAQHGLMSQQVEQLRATNAELKNRVQELRTNPRAIEAAARTQLGMVRAGEIVVPLR